MCEVVVDDTSAAAPGDVMRLRRGEGLSGGGGGEGSTAPLDQGWLLGGAVENCSYTFRADGSREVFADRFGYFGFRYLDLHGFPGGGPPPADAVTCWFTHTDLERSSASLRAACFAIVFQTIMVY